MRLFLDTFLGHFYLDTFLGHLLGHLFFDAFFRTRFLLCLENTAEYDIVQSAAARLGSKVEFYLWLLEYQFYF